MSIFSLVASVMDVFLFWWPPTWIFILKPAWWMLVANWAVEFYVKENDFTS